MNGNPGRGTARRPAPSARLAIVASWTAASIGLAACGGRCAADGVAPAAEAGQARARAAVLLEPVPIEPLPSRTVSPSIAPGAPAVAWTDPRLAFSLAVLALVVLWLRATARRAPPSLPAEVCSVLGEMPLGGAQVARVVRFGPKTILVGVSGGGCRTLAEIDDPAVTDRLVAACRAPEARATHALPLPAGLRRRLAGLPMLAEAIR